MVDDDLRLVLALHREGRSAGSPFYGFLAYWNALEAAFDLDEQQLAAFIDAAPARAVAGSTTTRHRRRDGRGTCAESNRDAVAHAVRKSSRDTVRDPDDPRDRGRLNRDSRLLVRLLEDRVEQRWGRWAVSARPAPKLVLPCVRALPR